MGDKYFLVQIRRTNGAYDKGVAVKDSANAARQSYYAYLSAYGYEHDTNTDYVQAAILNMAGGIIEGPIVDDRRPTSVAEPEAE